MLLTKQDVPIYIEDQYYGLMWEVISTLQQLEDTIITFMRRQAGMDTMIVMPTNGLVQYNRAYPTYIQISMDGSVRFVFADESLSRWHQGILN